MKTNGTACYRGTDRLVIYLWPSFTIALICSPRYSSPPYSKLMFGLPLMGSKQLSFTQYNISCKLIFSPYPNKPRPTLLLLSSVLDNLAVLFAFRYQFPTSSLVENYYGGLPCTLFYFNIPLNRSIIRYCIVLLRYPVFSRLKFCDNKSKTKKHRSDASLNQRKLLRYSASFFIFACDK